MTDGHISSFFFFFFNDRATTEIYPLSLHDALPICLARQLPGFDRDHHVDEIAGADIAAAVDHIAGDNRHAALALRHDIREDRKSTRLNSSHANISYAVFCLKKKKTHRATAHDDNLA